MTRVYLPTLGELIDRLCIVQMKSVFLPERKAEYDAEIGLIMQDITSECRGMSNFTDMASVVRAAIVLMLANRRIWEAETEAVSDDSDRAALLLLIRSINVVRHAAKNEIAKALGERREYKADCLSAALPERFGNWEVFK